MGNLGPYGLWTGKALAPQQQVNRRPPKKKDMLGRMSGHRDGFVGPFSVKIACLRRTCEATGRGQRIPIALYVAYLLRMVYLGV